MSESLYCSDDTHLLIRQSSVSRTMPRLYQLASLPQSRNVCTRSKRNIQSGTKGEIIMDAQDIIELIEYFRKLQNIELEF